MDVCQNERLLGQGIEVPENILFSCGTGSSAQYQNRPDAVFVCSIPGWLTHFNPCKIPPQDRDVHSDEPFILLVPAPFPPWKLQLR
eukprot:1155105-Pelagomonas_calceolata.AAC.8